MTLNTVTLTWDLADLLQAGIRATLSLTPNAVLTDAANHVVIPEVQRSAQFVNGTGSLAGIIACDNGTILPSGWAYTLTVSVLGQGELLKETVQINFANGATQDLSALIPLSPAPGLVGYLPLPSGTPQAGYVPTATGTGEASSWAPSGTGGSGYPANPVVSGSASAGNVLTATDSTHATWQPPSGGGGITPPAGDIGGTTGTPTVVSTHLSSALPIAQGGTGQGTQQAAIDALAGAVTSGLYLRGNGTHVVLGAIQAADVPALAYDASGAAATAQANAQTYADTNKLAKSSNLSDVGTRQTALNNLAGAVTSGLVLRGNGSNVTLAAIQAGDVPTLNQSTTGTAANVTGTVAIANGGTGQVTQQAALDAVAGAVTSGLVLRGNGTHVVLAAIQAGDVPTLNQNTSGSSASCTGNAATATNLAGGATLPAYLAPKVVTLTFVGAGTTLVDASLANAFNLTLTASTTTLGNPSNPVDGEVIRVRLIQDATGSRTIAYGTAYDFGASGAPTLSTAASKVDILGFEYVASISKWCYLGSGLGF
jgi:hypothetical protein